MQPRAASSLSCLDATPNTASSIRIRDGDGCGWTWSARPTTRCMQMPGVSDTRLSWEMATCTGHLSFGWPGGSSGRSPWAIKADSSAKAAGQQWRTAAQARCRQEGGPVWFRYTRRCSRTQSLRRNRLRMNPSPSPQSSTWKCATTPSCSRINASSRAVGTMSGCPGAAPAGRAEHIFVDQPDESVIVERTRLHGSGPST